MADTIHKRLTQEGKYTRVFYIIANNVVIEIETIGSVQEQLNAGQL